MADDWNDVLLAELESADTNPQPPLGNPAGSSSSSAGGNPLARQRGRPRGSSRFMVDAVREFRADAAPAPLDEDVLEPDIRMRRNLELARAARGAAVLERKKSSDKLAAAFGPEGNLTSMGSSLQKTLGAALLQVQQHGRKPQQSNQMSGGDKAISHILDGDVLTCSSSAVAKMTGSTRTVIQRSLLNIGAATVEGAGLLWGVMLGCLDSVRQATKNMVPLLFCINMKYDETPTKVRVAVASHLHDTSGSGKDGLPAFSGGDHILVPKVASNGQHLQRFLQLQNIAPRCMPQSATHAKILQTELELGMLYENIAGDGKKSHVWVKGSVPCPLQAMDRSTGEAQLSCLLENIATVPELKRFADPFILKMRTTTTDRYGANGRTEEGMRGQFPGFVSLHLACDVHRCSTSIGNALKTCQTDITGLLNSALALSDLGSVKKLRDALTAILFDELRVEHSQPPTEQTSAYRSQVFDVYLPVTGVVKAVEKINRKRRFILSALLNGFIMMPCIQHFCPRGCCRNIQETYSYMSLFLTWALIPFACPVLCRKSWIGQLGNLHFVAILEAHHGLFVRLMHRFFGRPVPAVQAVQADSADHWLQVLQEEVSEAARRELPSADGDVEQLDADGDGHPGRPLPSRFCLFFLCRSR